MEKDELINAIYTLSKSPYPVIKNLSLVFISQRNYYNNNN